MLKRQTLAALCVFLSVMTMAAKHTPLPTEAYVAKTIYIDNQTGVQQTVDTVTDDITKWGRLSPIPDRSKADLIATFTKIQGLDKGTTVISAHLGVSLQGAADPFFQDEELARGFHLENNRLGLSAGKCIEKFRSRLEEKH